MDDPIEWENVGSFFFFILLGLLSLLHKLDAQRGQKVDSLSNIEALWKAAVVGFEECADVISGMLIGFVDRDAVINELKRIEHECDSI